MQRIEASKLLQLLLEKEQVPNIKVIVTENQIYRKVIEEQIYKEAQHSPPTFSGKTAIVDYVEYAATGSLFFAQQKSVVELPEKLTAKQWEEEKRQLQRMPSKLEVSAFFFANMSYKNILKAPDFAQWGTVYLCYEPNEFELYKVVDILFSRYPSFSKKNKSELSGIAQQAIETYSSDLIACDLHFSLMEKAGVSFTEAMVGNPEVNGFHVAEAIARGDLYLIELRMSQCEACGEEASSILMAVVYFLKQVCAVMKCYEETKNLKTAFEKAYIPYPAQARIQKAMQTLSAEKLFQFFIVAPKLELILRGQKNGHKLLATEFISWLS